MYLSKTNILGIISVRKQHKTWTYVFKYLNYYTSKKVTIERDVIVYQNNYLGKLLLGYENISYLKNYFDNALTLSTHQFKLDVTNVVNVRSLFLLFRIWMIQYLYPGEHNGHGLHRME